MRGRATEIKVLDGSAELRISRHWAKKEKLLQRQFALKNIAFTQSPLAFEIERGDDLFVQNDVSNIGRVLGDGIDHVVAEGFFLIAPIKPGPQLIRRILNEAGKNVFAGRRDRRIGERRNYHVDIRTPRKVSVLGVIVSAFH